MASIMLSSLRGNKKASRTTTRQWPDPRAIREKPGLNQTQFATLIGISPRTLQNRCSFFSFPLAVAIEAWDLCP